MWVMWVEYARQWGMRPLSLLSTVRMVNPLRAPLMGAPVRQIRPRPQPPPAPGPWAAPLTKLQRCGKGPVVKVWK